MTVVSNQYRFAIRSRITLIAGALALFSLTGITGCVGPMGCGPMGCDSGGCDAGGPIILGHANTGCQSCSDCGELYVDPWINHPADACDPCDVCGNYNGQSCGKCRSVFGGIAHLWGYRCDGGCDGGCDSCQVPMGHGALYAGSSCGCETACDCGVEPACGMEPACGVESCGGCASCGGGHIADGAVISDGSVIVEHGSTQRHLAKPYRPARTRQIFRSRAAEVTSVPHASSY
ncbi:MULTISPECIES: hypothetical protein [Crateriforma]|uniref:Uncharacterized protein n=1 Tax=Crateriforma conspicua TaxID=2527996 RepID=A0A5C6FZY5_9PLAN|nr:MULTISPECIES: hypothetical protein [Crateriforma]TWU66563.1 hypothetical protein V7x_21300 [Crateriforma conspicua]